jgi:hypothetical protein
MLSDPEPSVPVSNIPGVTELRKALGYRDLKQSQAKIFIGILKDFRREYRTPSGVLGTDLRHWKLAEQQEHLNGMAVDFLERYGAFLWPDVSGEDGSSRLVYSRDEFTYVAINDVKMYF